MASSVVSSVTLNVHVPAGQQPATSAGRAELGVNVPVILNASVHWIASGLSSIGTVSESPPTPQPTISIEKITQAPAFCAMAPS